MFFLGWFGISGFLVSTSTCPFCGQTGCPVGVGQAAGIGFLSSFFIWLTGRRKTLPTQEEPHRHEPPAGENDGSPREE
ncbi:MAG: hypothetical protein GX444_10220 [Myxococcales bacterium]|nr:hypothetical protein [Myxococcales bacterium]